MDIAADMDMLARMMRLEHYHSSTTSDPLPQINHFTATCTAPPPLTYNDPSYSSPFINPLSSTRICMREMIFRIAVMQPVHIDPESVKPPKRRNVKISKDPQSVAARHRRERISQKIRILQRLVPGCTKMDTASMLDEAIHYVKFLKKLVQSLEQVGNNPPVAGAGNAMGHLLKGSCSPDVLMGAMQQQVLRS